MSEWDRVKAGFMALVRTELARLHVDYLGLYPAKVVAQNPDGTLELEPEDRRLPGISAVPIRIGIPGATVRVLLGARVLLAFEGGSPSAPVATLWDSASVVEVVLETAALKLGGDAATDAVVRGTTYRAAEDALLDLFKLAFTAITAGPITAPTQLLCADAAAGITAFKMAAASYLSPVVKTL